MTEPVAASEPEQEWTVTLLTDAVEDLKWFDATTRKLLLRLAMERLTADPKAESRNLKTLRHNPVVQRELRLLGHFRVLFDVNEDTRNVVIKVIGEKRGNTLIVRGQEYKAHHETDFPE